MTRVQPPLDSTQRISRVKRSELKSADFNTVRVENFEGGKFRAIPDFALFRKFRGY